MKNEIVEMLMKSANKAFMDLHAVLGMDFCAPYGIAYLSGPYTVNKAVKAATAGGYTAGDLLVILTRNAGKAYYSNSLFLVTVEHGGKIKIDYKTPWRVDRTGLKSLYSKSFFEEVRKSEEAETFILWQRREYLKTTADKPFDKTARYKLLKADYCYDPNSGRKYIDRLTLEQIDEKGTVKVYKIKRYSWRNGERTPATVADVIDKSGYFVQERREDLKRRAVALRAEREKAAFNMSDNSDKVADLARQICEKKAELVQMLSDANTSKEFAAVAGALSTWKGLSDAASKYERFREAVESKSFKSVSECEAEYRSVAEMIAHILEEKE